MHYTFWCVSICSKILTWARAVGVGLPPPSGVYLEPVEGDTFPECDWNASYLGEDWLFQLLHPLANFP